MYTKHKIYAKIYNLFKLFSTKNNRVCFLTNKNGSFESNLKYISNELSHRKTNNGDSYVSCFIPKDKLSLLNIYKLATSKYVFLTDNFFPLAFMNVNNQIFIQLWHGTGLFKKFGFDCLNDSDKEVMLSFSHKINLVSVSSSNVIDTYAHNFAIDKSKVLPLGIPRNDFYSPEHCNDDYISKLRESLDNLYPSIKGKKLVLYAPSFRENPKFNNVFNYFDIEKFINQLGEDYALAIRLHPNYFKFTDEVNQINLEDLSSKYDIIDFTYFKDEQKLFLLSDILITDYSSVMVDYTILNKPILLFAYDLDNYIQNERGFYFDYKEEVPGKIVYNIDELIESIKNNDFCMDKLDDFVKFQFGRFDSNSSKRILDHVLDD